MNHAKRDYGWILCPSTRFLGKFYYFNPATGEAVWNLSDKERRMASRPSFTNSVRWHAYPEPDSPPEDTSNAWGYQSEYRTLHHPTQSFGQSVFPKYYPNVIEHPYNPYNMWGMPQHMYMRPGMMPMPPVMNMPQFDPMSQMWNYGNPKHVIPEHGLFSNTPYMQKVNSFNQDLNRQVFCPKPKQNVMGFPVINNNNKEIMKKRRMSMESGMVKEPLFKRFKTQNDLHTENTFGRDIFQKRSFDSTGKISNIPVLQKHNKETTCNCMLSERHENLMSKSHDNLANIVNDCLDINREESYGLSRSKSMGNLTEIPNQSPSEVSSNFSLKDSFIFPLKKSDSSKWIPSKSFDGIKKTDIATAKKKLQNATVTQSGTENKDLLKNPGSEADLRYILLAKRRKGSVTDTKDVNQVDNKKIKTSYSGNKLTESVGKKHVTFSLGVEESVVDDDNNMDIPDVPEAAEVEEPEAEVEEPEAEAVAEQCFVVAELEVLLTEFQLVEEFVQSEASYTLLVPAGVQRAVQAACSGPAPRALPARRLARLLADKQTHIQVYPPPPQPAEEPALDCCVRLFHEGLPAILITNNEETYNKALSMNIECYTIDDVKEYLDAPKPEVSFDLKKIDNDKRDSPPTVPVKCTRKQLFGNLKSNQFFLNKESNKSTQNHIDDNFESQKNVNQNENFRIQKKINETNQSFFDKEFDLLEETNRINREIKKLNLREKVDTHNLEVLATNKQLNEKKNINIFKNGDVAKEKSHSAKKISQNINVYNLEGLIKSYSIKSKDMEDMIKTRMDEYFCCFSQIMESILLDVLMDMSVCVSEERCENRLQSLLELVGAALPAQRTARALLDRLAEGLEAAFVLVNGRLMLNLEPYEFVKLFGCGSLLVQVLKSILPSSCALADGECLLARLERELEQWGAEPAPAPPPSHPAGDVRHAYVKERSEVLQYLTTHFPDWQSYQRREADGDNATHNDCHANKTTHNCHTDRTTDNTNCQTEKTIDNKTAVNPTSKVVRTFGRNLGLLKLDPTKPLILSENNQNTDEKEEDDYKENNENENIEKRKHDEEQMKNKPKILRKLAIESLNLPPKMKEIDVEKRKQNDKELSNMLNQMISCDIPSKPVTKFYNLRSIIVTNDNKRHIKDNGKTEENQITHDNETNSKDDTKSNNKIDSTTKTNESKNLNNNKQSNDKSELNNAVDIKNNPLNLDELDYSDIQESVMEIDESNAEDDSSSNKNQITESDSNHVTTTQHINDQNEATPATDNENNDNDKIVNDNNDNASNNNESDDNDDSGIESVQAYSFAQRFFKTLSETFLMIVQFIEASVRSLRRGAGARGKELLWSRAERTRTVLARIIDNLQRIISRECSGCARAALLARGARAPDKRVTIYSRVISKCMEQARVLNATLLLVCRLARDHCCIDDLSDVSKSYSNLFE